MTVSPDVAGHWAAVRSLLEGSDPVRPLRVFVSDAGAEPVLPYVVLHPSGSAGQVTSTDGDTDWRDWPFQITAVGTDPDQALAAAQRAEERVLDIRPAVPGRVTGPVRKTLTFPLVADRSKRPAVYVARDTWTFASTPA